MKKFLKSILPLAVISFIAPEAQALFTKCKMEYQYTGFHLAASISNGTAQIKCKDAAGSRYNYRAKILVPSVGATIGVCEARGQIWAIGAGFTLDQFIKVIASGELGVVFGTGQAIGLQAGVNPFGINADFGGTKVNYDGDACIHLAQIKAIVTMSREKIN